LAFAVSVADCVVLTADTAAVNPTLVAFPGTVTELGTLTAPLLLDRVTLIPPLRAAALRVTVHASEPFPAIEALAHERVLNTGAIAGFSCRVKLFVTPLAFAVSVADCVVLTADTVAVNPTLVALPGTVTELGTFTAPLLVERVTLIPPLGAAALNVTVQASEPAPFIEELAHERVLKVGTIATEEAFSCREKVFATPFNVAMSATDCEELTADAVAVNPTLVALAGTVTELGTFTAPLLLERFTLIPPLGAAALNVTVQVSDPAPVIEALAQERALNVGKGVPESAPLPCSLIFVAGLADVLVITLNSPTVSVDAFGLKWTLKVRDSPAATMMGSFAAPSIENDAFDNWSPATFTCSEPSFDKVTWALAELPTFTAPKSTESGEATNESVSEEEAEAPLVTTPPQPDRARMQHANIANKKSV